MLQLNGHTITGSNPNTLQRWGVIAESATIEGPGEITAPGGIALVYVGRKLSIRDVTLRDSLVDLSAAFTGKIDATNLTVTGNSLGGIQNTRLLTGSNLVVSGNGLDPEISDSGFDGAGITATRVRVDGLVAEGNGGAGVGARAVSLLNSSLSGNDGAGQGIDILSSGKPRLVETYCVASGHVIPTPFELVGTWGVCSGD